MKEDCTTCAYSTVLESDKVTCVEFPKRGEFSPEICHNYCPDEGRFSFNSFESFESEDEDTAKTNRIVLVSVDKLHPHPNNPRKELGDLTELAESIKVSGIFQNLTAVPWFSSLTGKGCDDPDQQEEMGYIVIIGHRRLAAAKLAGLKEVPCAIVEMDTKTQIATMLLENMQRSDLTVYEQAQGFQMMMDLGETMKDISEKTGFSETTVRRRVKLLDLDKDKFKESVERGATIMDFMELDKIKSKELKNEVLQVIGTPNFKFKLDSVIGKEKREEDISKIVEFLSTFATKAGLSDGLTWVKYYNPSDKLEKPDDAGETKYFYIASEYSVTLYKERKEQQIETSPQRSEVDKQRQRIEAKRPILQEMRDRAYKLRNEFVCNISNTIAKKYIGNIIEFALYSFGENFINFNNLAEIIGIELNDDEFEFNQLVEGIRKQPEKVLLQSACYASDSEREGYYSWNCEHKENQNLDRLYDFLITLGYEMSDEEKALRDGTHELFLSQG